MNLLFDCASDDTWIACNSLGGVFNNSWLSHRRRTLTTVCWACNQVLVFGFCLAAFFPGTDAYHIIGRLWKKLLKPKLLHWMKKYESGVRIFSRNLPSCRMFFCLATSTFVQKIRNVKSLRSDAVAASFPAKMIHQNNTHSSARPRFALVNGQTTTDFLFFARMFPCMNITVKPWVSMREGINYDRLHANNCCLTK